MEDLALKKVQAVETEILAVFDGFCKKHNLKYSLYAGTLLGAVRHGGFIPWDDDIDVIMERAEYEKFLKLWREERVSDYYLQGTDEPNHSYIDHSKIRKDGTVYASEWEKENLPHNGIWLDIFPLDKVPTEEKKRKKYLNKNKFRMIYTRGYPLKGRGLAYYLITKLLLIGTRKSQLRKRNKLDEYIKSTMNMESGFEFKSLACVDDLKLTYPTNLMDEYTTIKFGEYEFSVVKDYDLMLKITFGDYMILPPEEERVCKHKPKYVEF